MREILCRGKRIDNGKWVEGFYIEALEPMDEPVVLSYISNISGKCDIILPYTVGQYTGIKDKNGKKIFEGDIVSVEREVSWSKEQYHSALTEKETNLINLSVVWDGGKFILKNAWISEDLSNFISYNNEIQGPCCTGRCFEKSERHGHYSSTNMKIQDIIGNVHDNPEMMVEN